MDAAQATRTLRSAAELAAAGFVAPDRVPALARVAERYAVAITPGLADLIGEAGPTSALARQFVPQEAELDRDPSELADPIGDEAHAPVEGIVHRYPDRVLLKPVSACAVYCRYCFRRETVGPGKADALGPAALGRALDYIRQRPAIWEVILTGGDPLVLSPRRLGGLMRDLAAIDHVRVLRIHSRVPVVAPERITDDLVAAMRPSGATTWLAVHANHPDEIGPAASGALARLADAGVPLLGQSVLLRGVNDDPAVLEALLRRLVENRVKPYYLHHTDLAPGTAHFRTAISDGQALMRALRGRVSGLCQPEYVIDIPGGHGKSPIGPRYLSEDDAEVLDWQGVAHTCSAVVPDAAR